MHIVISNIQKHSYWFITKPKQNSYNYQEPQLGGQTHEDPQANQDNQSISSSSNIANI